MLISEYERHRAAIPPELNDAFQEWAQDNMTESDWAWENLPEREQEFLDYIASDDYP